jgi:hypothetical protein
VVSLSLPYLPGTFWQSARSKGDGDASKNKVDYIWEEGALIEARVGKEFLVGKIASKLQNGQFSSCIIEPISSCETS